MGPNDKRTNPDSRLARELGLGRGRVVKLLGGAATLQIMSPEARALMIGLAQKSKKGAALLFLAAALRLSAQALPWPMEASPARCTAFVGTLVPVRRVVTIKAPRAEYPRAIDEGRLMEMLERDFRNIGEGKVNYNLRRDLDLLMRQIQKEP